MEKYVTEMLTMRKATMEDWEWAHEVSYRAHRKLISSGRGHEYGGMSPEDVRNSIRNGEVYFFFRKGDEIPVMVVSILRQEKYPTYEKLFDEIIDNEEIPEHPEWTDAVAILNAVAVRPELWGQGYCRKGVKQLTMQLREHQGIRVLVGNYYHDVVRGKILETASENGAVHTGEPYKRTRSNGEILERRRFAFVI